MDISDTRDVAVQALTKIEQHMTTCDRRYEEWKDRQEQTIEYLGKLSTQIGEMNDKTGIQIRDLRTTIDEAKGAAKMGKIVISSISGISGIVGGIVGHFVVK